MQEVLIQGLSSNELKIPGQKKDEIKTPEAQAALTKYKVNRNDVNSDAPHSGLFWLEWFRIPYYSTSGILYRTIRVYISKFANSTIFAGISFQKFRIRKRDASAAFPHTDLVVIPISAIIFFTACFHSGALPIYRLRFLFMTNGRKL